MCSAMAWTSAIQLLGLLELFFFPYISAPGTGGNSWVQHARYMFDVHGQNVSLVYESPIAVGSMSLLPALINDPTLILASLQSISEPGQSELLFHAVPPTPKMSKVRWFQFTRHTHGLCFCCTHKGNWNTKVPGFNQSAHRFKALKNYTACNNEFWLSAQHGGKFGYMNASLNPTGLVNVSTEHSTLADIYPDFPFMQANFTGSGSICGHMFVKDPNLWFFFDQYATNFHPGYLSGACAGIGFLTFPVQVFDPLTVTNDVVSDSTLPFSVTYPTSSPPASSNSSFSERRKRRSVNLHKDRHFGPLGPHCKDEVIVRAQMSSSDAGRVGGGSVTGMLTLGSYPGIIAQENRHSILGLTCRLEKTVNATTKIIRDLQNEIEQLQQIQLQHRLALDYLLARSHTGFCKIVGTQCIVRFHNLNRSIEHELADLHAAITNNIYTSPWTGFWDFLWSWLPDLGWLRMLLMYGIIFLIIAIVICCFLQCIPSLIHVFLKCCRKSVKSMSLSAKQMYQIKYHVLHSRDDEEFFPALDAPPTGWDAMDVPLHQQRHSLDSEPADVYNWQHLAHPK